MIRQRLDQITREVRKRWSRLRFEGPGRAAGRADRRRSGTQQHCRLTQAALGRSVRVGRPKQVTGLPDAHSGPAFSTLVGLAMLAFAGTGEGPETLPTPVAKNAPGRGVLGGCSRR